MHTFQVYHTVYTVTHLYTAAPHTFYTHRTLPRCTRTRLAVATRRAFAHTLLPHRTHVTRGAVPARYTRYLPTFAPRPPRPPALDAFVATIQVLTVRGW